MRILCLHGRGSNNEIFQLQTASIRAHLPDFEFEFVQGTVPHTEGNWSLYTATFPNAPLYTYYNPLSAPSIAQTESDLLSLLRAHGPFDGILGYSGGAALAAQVLIRAARERDKQREDCFDSGGGGGAAVCRFAVFINGASPLRVFRLADEELCGDDADVDAAELIGDAAGMFVRPSALRKRRGRGEGVEDGGDGDQAGADVVRATLESFRGRRLADGTPFLCDGEWGLTRWNAMDGGEEKSGGEVLIDIPTLHIRSATEKDHHYGAHLLAMCDDGSRKEFHHGFGHDFPRGKWEVTKIAEMIRELAEGA